MNSTSGSMVTDSDLAKKTKKCVGAACPKFKTLFEGEGSEKTR